MTKTDLQEPTTPRKPPSALVQGVIIAQGIATLVAAITLTPLGVALILANVVGAVGTRGTRRHLFVGFAIAAAVLYVLAAGLFLPASTTTEVGTPQDL